MRSQLRTSHTLLPMTGYTVRELLDRGTRSVSFEFFPPKTDEGERLLWQALRELEPLSPTFVSVTYGAGGSTRDRTVRVTQNIATDTTLTPVAHLTVCRRLARRAAARGRAVRGRRRAQHPRAAGRPAGRSRPAVGRAPRGSGPRGRSSCDWSSELGDFSVVVAAFPEGHPEADDLDSDARMLLRKADAGADFAITQLVLQRRRLLPAGRPGRRAGLHHADHAGHHAGDERLADPADDRAVGGGVPARPGAAAARGAGRSQRGARDRRRGRLRAVRNGCSTAVRPGCTSTR